MTILRILAAVAFAALGGAATAQCAAPPGAEAVISRTNLERAAAGRAALAVSAPLTRAAQNHACDMAARGYFSHQGADGSTLSTRVQAQGIRPCFAAENIARGQRSATDVMTSWMHSAGHRQNILDRRAQEIGVGLAHVTPGGEPVWVMVLGRGC
ncbi:MAG: CAP domain-containing protein [Paracoccaceae bacterium]